MRLPFCYALGMCILAMMGLSGAAKAQYVRHISSYVMDARTGATLVDTDSDLQRYPASLTKLMTLYLTFQALQKGEITLPQSMPVSIHASAQPPSKLGVRPGSQLTVEQAILALVTKSANDVACVLGEFLGGGDEARFAEKMTLEARHLGMSNTTFRNASGLPDPDQITTARDMARLARHLIKDYPQYYHYFAVENFTFHSRVIPSHDPLLKLYPGADGLKTGYTELAGHNLISSAQQGHARIIGVVLGAPSNESRNQTMITLLNEGFIAKGQMPLPLLKAPKAASPSRVASYLHMRRGVVLVSYHPPVGHRRVIPRINASRRGHHRS